MSGPRLLTLDIETSPNAVDTWGLWDQNIALSQLHIPTRVLCWAAKWHDEPKVFFRSEFHDSRAQMLDEIWALTDEADILQHYNGASFDLPHLRREWLLAEYLPPSPSLDVDLFKIVKQRFRFASNKLDHVAEQLGVGKKLRHPGHEMWVKALAGDPAAQNLMKRYCKRDVVITEGVGDKLKPWAKSYPSMGIFDDKPNACPRCAQEDTLKPRGYAYTTQSRYQRYCCSACGAWTKGGKVELRATTTGI